MVFSRVEYVECVGCCCQSRMTDMRYVGDALYCSDCRAGILRFRSLKRRREIQAKARRMPFSDYRTKSVDQ